MFWGARAAAAPDVLLSGAWEQLPTSLFIDEQRFRTSETPFEVFGDPCKAVSGLFCQSQALALQGKTQGIGQHDGLRGPICTSSVTSNFGWFPPLRMAQAST